MAAGVRGYTNGGGDTDLPCGNLQYFSNNFARKRFTSDAQKEIVIFEDFLSEVAAADPHIAYQLLCEVGRLWDNTFFISFAVPDSDVIRRYVFWRHHDHLVAANASIKEKGNDGLVADATVVSAGIVVQHPFDFQFGKGFDDDLRLTDVLHLGCGTAFDVALLFQVVEEGLEGFQQIVDVGGFASGILLDSKETSDVVRSHIFHIVNPKSLQMIHQKDNLSSVIPQSLLRQMAAFAIVDVLVQTILQMHKKTPFLRGKPQKKG